MQYWVRKGRTVWLNRRSTFEFEDCVTAFTDIAVAGPLARTTNIEYSSRVRIVRGMVIRRSLP